MDPSTLMPLLQTGLEENNGLNSNANDEDEDDAIEEDDEEETLEDDFSEYPGGPAAVSGNNNVPGHFLTESSSFNDGPFGQISNLSKGKKQLFNFETKYCALL